jgi:hypothetical protein
MAPRLAAPLLALGVWGALALVGAARDDTDEAMDPYGRCFDFDDGEGGVCSLGAQDDGQHDEKNKLGHDCRTGCSSYNSLTKATHCCSKGCCLCGGPQFSLYTSGPKGSGYIFPDDSNPNKEEGHFHFSKYDIFGLCTAGERAKHDERPEHPNATRRNLQSWQKDWSANDQQQYQCPSGCVTQGVWPAIVGEAFEGKDAFTACDAAAIQVWKLADKSANPDACEYLGKRWDETCKESPGTPDGLACANQTLADLIPSEYRGLLPTGPVWTGPIVPWASASYFLRLVCAGASEPWLNYSWGKGPGAVLAELPKELGEQSTGHYDIGTKNCPSFSNCSNCSAKPKSAWSGGWEELRKSCRKVQDPKFHDTYDSRVIDSCDLAVKALCPRGDGSGKPGTYPTAEKCKACVSKKHLGEKSLRWLFLTAMCGSAAGYVKLTVEKQATLSCQRDQSDEKINKVCCKSNCCKRAPPPPPPKQWYELWTTWVMIGLGALVLCFFTLYYRKYRRRDKAPSVLRQSLLGGEHKMPHVLLAEHEVPARWAAAQPGDDDAGEEMRTIEGGGGLPSLRRPRQGRRQALAVMFSDAHVRELKPGNMGWKQQVVGSGSFGKVYRARWRGREVAVKELRLPQETDAHASGEAKIMLSRQLQETVEEFTAEISERAVCLHLCGLC